MAASGKSNGGRYYEYVIDSIKGMIARGELKCGEKIPSERELADRFNVSRVPIREALKILEYMGILDSSRGDGTYVRNITVEDLIGKMDFALTATTDTLIDLTEMRINLESFAAYRAALHRTDEDIEAIRGTILDMRTAKKNLHESDENVDLLRRLSQQFHLELVKAAHNSVLTSIYENLYELLDISRQFTISTSGISYDSILAHEALLNKIIEQDAEGARESMEGHLAEVRLRLNAILSQVEAEELIHIHSAG